MSSPRCARSVTVAPAGEAALPGLAEVSVDGHRAWLPADDLDAEAAVPTESDARA